MSLLKFYRRCGISAAKKILFLLAFSQPLHVLAQTISVYPTTVTAPRGSYQTVTAIVNGTNNKTVTWTSDGGQIVGSNPCAVNEPCTVALYSTGTGTFHLTATSNANGGVAASSTVTFTASPTPTTGHPRLLVNASMLAGLQAKATSSNVVYQSLRTVAISAYNSDNAVWSWSCNGGSGLPSQDESNNWEQQNAYIYAFMSMIDPSDSTYKWGCYGRDVWTYVMKQALNGSTSLPENEWSDSSQFFALTTDFLMAGNYLSAADQAQARTFLAFMVKLVLSNGVGDSWDTSSAHYNSSAEFNMSNPFALTAMRAMGNNYTESKLLYLVAAGLTFDDNATDDPALPNSCGASRYQVCADYSAGSLHAYWNYFVGSALYLQWAHLEDPNVSWQAYQAAFGNLPSQPQCENTDLKLHPCFGDGRGGEGSGGSWYDYSIYRLRYALNAIHTAGYDDPILYGPQISLVNSSWWDLKYIFDLAFLTGYGPNNGLSGPAGGTPAYNYLTTGDSNTYFRMPNDMWTESATMVADTYSGRTDRTNALKWIIMNTAFGGPLGNQGTCTEYCGFDAELTVPEAEDIDEDLFISLPAGDPVSSLPSDPRPSLPTDLYNGSLNQHIMTRSSWSPSGTLFSYWCPNTLTDHEHQFCGRFDIYSNGEYITKGRTEFNDYNDSISMASQQGLVAIANGTGSSCTTGNSCYFAPAFDNGGQMWHSYQEGLATLQHSELPSYVAAIVDDTNDYNGSANQFGDYNDVSGASRSLVYLRGTNQVVYYDRAATGHAASKALYQNTTGALSVQANTASWHTRSGNQTVYFTSLLPSGAIISDPGLLSSSYWEQPDDWEVSTALEVSAGSPTSAQFLSVMQWGGSSYSPNTPTLVQSTGGNNFDGALLGSSLVMFMRSWPATFTGVTYPASGATTQYISDLAPNATYTITGDGTPATATADTAGVLAFPSSGSGSISVGVGNLTLTGLTVSPASATIGIGATQQFTATCNYSNGGSSDCTSSATWSSSATGLASILSSGLLTAITTGTVTVTATSGSLQGQASVTISLTQAATPTFSPAGGNYTSAQTVSISDATAGATIYYTTNGSTPTTASTVYSGPITVSSSETINAIAVASGSGNSAVGSAVYTINQAQAATPTFSPAGGTYSSAQTVSISDATSGATIHYTTNGSTPTTSSSVYSGPITVSSTETIEAMAVASGYSNSGVGTAAYSIGQNAAAPPTFSPAGGTYNSAQTVSISDATSGATIYYTTNGSTPTTGSAVYSGPITVSSTETLKAMAAASGSSNSAVATAAYTISSGQTSTPTFSPTGGTYSSAQTVSISDATSGATIYYTTNGSTPTTGSAVFSGPITVSSTETLKAMAAASGSSNSAVATAAYTISSGQTSTPTFSPTGGTYSSAQTVSISDATSGATIYYTTNGSTPTTGSAVFSGPITVSSTETLKAMAAASGSSNSAVATAAYTISVGVNQAAAPTFSPGAGNYTSAQTITISSTTPSATIYFTTNGTAPTTGSAVYNGPITVSSSETIEAMAVASGSSNSPIATAAYTITVIGSPIVTAAATPTFTPGSGAYASAQTVTIASSTPSAVLYYTTDGSTPTTSSAVYSGPLTVASSETLKAMAAASGYSNSAVATSGYTITAVSGDFSVSASPTSVTVSNNQSGSTSLAVLPTNGFSSQVSFSCVGLPAGTSCSFAPSTVTPSGSVASTICSVGLTANTSGTSASNNSKNPLFPGSVLAVALCFFGFKKRGRLQMLLLLLVSAAGISLLNGCGGSFATNSASISSSSKAATPVTVIATSGSLQHTITLSVTMK